MDASAEQVTVDAALLKVLVCPRTKARLVQRGAWLYSTDAATRLKYPVRQGIPQLLAEEAVAVDAAEFAQAVGTGG